MELKAGILFDMRAGLSRFDLHISILVLVIAIVILILVNHFILKQPLITQLKKKNPADFLDEKINSDN